MTADAYQSPSTLYRIVRRVLRFWYPDCIDLRHGGYVAQLDEQDGHVYDGESKHLVATARAVHNFSVGVILDGPVWCRSAAEHGLQFLSTVQWDDEHEGYDWMLRGRETDDDTRYCYGHAFVVLAAARGLQAGIPGAREELGRAVEVVDERFYRALTYYYDHPEEMRRVERQRQSAIDEHAHLTTDPDEVRD